MSEEQKAELKAEVETAKEKLIKEAAERNAKITGIGPRWKVGMTKGKNPTPIIFEFLDESQPETIPKSVQQFGETIPGADDEKITLDYLIRGYNDAKAEMAQDPLGEYVSNVWSAEVALTFRTAVRNYAKGLKIELEDAVNIIRPGFAKKFGE